MSGIRVAFDLDGTLIDSAPDIRAAASRVLAAEGAAPLTLDETRAMIGEGAPVLVARMRAARGLPRAAEPRMLGAFLAVYGGAVGLTRAYPGAQAALDALGRAGHRLSLVTNKPMGPARAILAHLGLARHFDVVQAGDGPLPRKPDPAMLLAALAACGTGPAIYVGDGDADAEAARRAGVPLLLHARGYARTPPDRLRHAARFDDFAALPDLIRRHAAPPSPP
jgi:phosphoglycolate phosphatase